MKKLLTINAVIALCLALGFVGLAQAGTVYFSAPPPYVQQYNTTDTSPTPTSDITNVLQNPPLYYNTYGATLDYVNANDETLNIYTQLGTDGHKGASFTETLNSKVTVVPADLILVNNASGAAYAVRLQSNGEGNVYSINLSARAPMAHI